MRLQFRLLLFSIFCFYTASSSCQFNKSDEALVKTTFTRTFDKKIISSYLASNEERKIQAALLSISHSEDSLFIPKIVQLNFNKYYETICFALGQLEANKFATDFLWQMFEKHPDENIQKSIVETLGKTGDSVALEKLLSLAEQKKVLSNCGFALAVYHFSLRKIVSPKSVPLLNGILAHTENGREETLFTLYRLGATDSLVLSSVYKLIRSEINKENPSQFIIQYGLEIFYKANFFPDELELLQKLSSSKDAIIRIETAKAGINFPFHRYPNFDFLTRLILDENPNVSRQLAVSLRKIYLNEPLLLFVQKQIENSHLSRITTGELFITLINHLQKTDIDLLKKYEAFVDKSFIYQSCGETATLSDSVFTYLLKQYVAESKENKLVILAAIMKHQKEFLNTTLFNDFVFGILSEKDISCSTSLIDELSNDFLLKNKIKFLKTIIADTKRNKNNPDFAGSVESYYNSLEKLDKRSAQIFCKILSSSTNYPIKKFVSHKLGNTSHIKNSGKYFQILWSRAFTYQSAIVTTSKGKFTIAFVPDAAPISVGNFCMLAEKNFFNGLKFHRVVPAFVIQGGDPENTGWGGSEIPIVSEFSPYQFQSGIVGMASSGKDTESSQWFVMQAFHPHLNGRYTVFGNVIDGFETILKTDQNDKILSVELIH